MRVGSIQCSKMRLRSGLPPDALGGFKGLLRGGREGGKGKGGEGKGRERKKMNREGGEAEGGVEKGRRLAKARPVCLVMS